MSRPILVHNLPEFDPALVPGFRVALRTRTAQELLAAVTAGGVAAVVLDLSDPHALATIAQIVETRPGLGIVGVADRSDSAIVLTALRAGCTDVTLRPLSREDLGAALERASAPAGTTGSGRTMALFGTVGGAGATTLACHLAVECAAVTRQPVALVDLDLEFGGVAGAFDSTPSFTLGDVARAGVIDAALIERAALALPSGVRLLARPPELDDARAIDAAVVPHILHAVRGLCPVTVLDLPRQLTPLVGAALELVDKLIVVVQLTVPSVRNARRLFEALQREGVSGERLEFVVNRYRRSVHLLSVETVEQELERPALGVVPSDFRAVHQALDMGRPLAHRNPVRAAIHEIARKIVGDTPGAVPPREGWRSRLSLRR